ncbi:class II aldolase/adducin family protein [Amycolatopsis minnesotensis]|uniref:Class II aldolase/adducin N-terminal domain-containing protein n=1 Tax=Amycolatopsis minnesotensis TaxID=337894 RepID=A0ABN2QYU8_9PSEU
MANDPIDELVELSQWLGAPERDLAILGEGNTSVSLAPGRLAVKASGAGLGKVEREHFVEVDPGRVLSILDRSEVGDEELAAHFADCRISGDRRPSIEVILHALAVRETGAKFVAHAHPTAVNGLLCSDRADALVAGHLFPDQVVVLGRHPLMVPYAGPGLELARTVKAALAGHFARHGAPPKILYLRNHGILALGETATDVRQTVEMTVKVARILTAALSVGQPAYLTGEQADRIEGREDEHHRRSVLARQR